ncbi:MAG: carbamoyl phosphate synthase small subunit [Clostridia bacterium]
MSKAYLVLENGTTFCGEAFGMDGEVTAEVVFATGMTGYLETLTDKSYFGQIVVQTFPLIGNYGVIPADFESNSIGPKAYIVKEWCQVPSNFRNEGDLDTFFKNRGVIGLCGIDTRTLTKTIREKGVMNGAIVTDPSHACFDKIHAYSVTDAVKSVSVKEKYIVTEENPSCHIALMDFGLKLNIARELAKRGAKVTVCPHTTTADELKAMGVDGIMLSNGPGDPKENVEVIENIKEMVKIGIPVFGICLGHQLLALAHDFDTSKLKYGHRGGNQPVKDMETGRVYISSQNHGYAVESSSINEEIAKEYFVNVNDKTCEGVSYNCGHVFSVQFHPEACGGPRDTSWLFDKFIGMIKEGK